MYDGLNNIKFLCLNPFEGGKSFCRVSMYPFGVGTSLWKVIVR